MRVGVLSLSIKKGCNCAEAFYYAPPQGEHLIKVFLVFCSHLFLSKLPSTNTDGRRIFDFCYVFAISTSWCTLPCALPSFENAMVEGSRHSPTTWKVAEKDWSRFPYQETCP